MKKLTLFFAMAVVMMTSCSSLKIVDPSAVVNAGSAAVQALTISDAQIKELCSQYMVETDGQNTILPADNSYTQRLDRIMSRFHDISDLNLNYKVYQSNTVNAFASGDGSVRVYTGLMDVMNDDELFAVIGHELGHLINKDVRDAYRASYLMVAGRYAIGAFSETAGAIAQGFLGDLSQELASRAYSRHQETKADETALKFCISNGVDPFAMYHALNVLLSLEGSSSQSLILEFLSTHPNTAKRATHIKEKAEKAGYTMTTSGSSGTTNTNSSNGVSVQPNTGISPSQNTNNTNNSGNSTVTPKKGFTPKKK